MPVIHHPIIRLVPGNSAVTLLTFGAHGQDLWPLPFQGLARWTGAMTDHTVVGDRVVLNTGFRAARARLRILALDGMLLRAAEVAYGEGTTALVQLAGPAAGLTRLADVCLEDLAETEDCAHIALQWEAIAADGKLFTVLDADLMLAPAGAQVTDMFLTGAYRPPPGEAGAGLGQTVVRCCATVAIGSFLDQVGCALVHPAGTAGPAGRCPVR